MVYNPDAAGVNKERLTAFVTTDLTSDQLDAVQEAFGRGACSQSPVPTIELFIEDRAEYHGLTHADIRRAVTGEEPFLVIDEQTPEDGGIWYIEGFASEDEVEDGEAENTNVVWKIRLKIEDVPIMHANYSIGNASIREDLDSVDVPYPAPENYEQDTLLDSGIDPDEDKYLSPTWITAESNEYEDSKDEEVLKTVSPRQEKLTRLKPEVAKANGLLSRWTHSSPAKDVQLPDGSTKSFPVGSVILQVDYNPEGNPGWYQRPEGSL